jgi:hypothetical protein
MAWVRLVDNASSTPPTALGIGTGTGGDCGLTFDKAPAGNGRPVGVEFGGSSGATAINLNYTGLDLFSYHHYAWTVRSPNSAAGWLAAYLDGRKVGSVAFASPMGAGGISKVMAVGASSNFAAAAYVQHSRLWSRVLTLGEIRHEMRSRYAVSKHQIIYDLPLFNDQRNFAGVAGVFDSGGSAVTVVTEVGPILGGPIRLWPVAPSAAVEYAGAQSWASVWRSGRV